MYILRMFDATIFRRSDHNDDCDPQTNEALPVARNVIDHENEVPIEQLRVSTENLLGLPNG